MKVTNTYSVQNSNERKDRFTQVHNRCVLLLNELKEVKA